MNQQTEKQGQPGNPGHWQLIRDVAAFQFKLAMDGLRDVLLSPVSIVAAIAGIISSRSDPGQYFYRLMHFGHRTDRWINLFGAFERNQGDSDISADHFVRRAEEIVLNEYHKGGTMHEMKHRADGVISRLQGKGRPSEETDSGEPKGRDTGKDQGTVDPDQ